MEGSVSCGHYSHGSKKSENWIGSEFRHSHSTSTTRARIIPRRYLLQPQRYQMVRVRRSNVISDVIHFVCGLTPRAAPQQQQPTSTHLCIFVFDPVILTCTILFMCPCIPPPQGHAQPQCSSPGCTTVEDSAGSTDCAISLVNPRGKPHTF